MSERFRGNVVIYAQRMCLAFGQRSVGGAG
jgi:hypothetical protein